MSTSHDDLPAHEHPPLPHPASVQRFSLPVWIPRSYMVRAFSRRLSRLRGPPGAPPHLEKVPHAGDQPSGGERSRQCFGLEDAAHARVKPGFG